MRRGVVGVSGASGMPLAQSLLRHLAALPDLGTHLIVSDGAERVLRAECRQGKDALARHAHAVHPASDLGAGPASGSWRHAGMIICPCSMSSLGAIAGGAGRNLIHRAADVTLKERRPLLLVVRETPFNAIHLRNMQAVTDAGATVMPFMPAFYTLAASLEDLMRHFAGRLLDELGIEHDLCVRWEEKRTTAPGAKAAPRNSRLYGQQGRAADTPPERRRPAPPSGRPTCRRAAPAPPALPEWRNE